MLRLAASFGEDSSYRSRESRLLPFGLLKPPDTDDL